jgi:hypothetical protein
MAFLIDLKLIKCYSAFFKNLIREQGMSQETKVSDLHHALTYLGSTLLPGETSRPLATDSSGKTVIRYSTDMCFDLAELNERFIPFDTSPILMHYLRELLETISKYTTLEFIPVSCQTNPALRFGFTGSTSWDAFQHFIAKKGPGNTYWMKQSQVATLTTGTRASQMSQVQELSMVTIAQSCTLWPDTCYRTLNHEVLHGLHIKHPRHYVSTESGPFMPNLYPYKDLTEMTYSNTPNRQRPLSVRAWQLWNDIFGDHQKIFDPLALTFVESDANVTSSQSLKTLDLLTLQRHPRYQHPQSSQLLKARLANIPNQTLTIDDTASNTQLLPSGNYYELKFQQANPFSELYLDLRGGFLLPSWSTFLDNYIRIPPRTKFSKLSLPPAKTTLILPKSFTTLTLEAAPSRHPIDVFFSPAQQASPHLVVKGATSRITVHFPSASNLSLVSVPFDISCHAPASVITANSTVTVTLCDTASQAVTFDSNDIPVRTFKFWDWVGILDREFNFLLDFQLSFSYLAALTSLISVALGYGFEYCKNLEFDLAKFHLGTGFFQTLRQQALARRQQQNLGQDVLIMSAKIALYQNLPFHLTQSFQLGQTLFKEKSFSGNTLLSLIFILLELISSNHGLWLMFMSTLLLTLGKSLHRACKEINFAKPEEMAMLMHLTLLTIQFVMAFAEECSPMAYGHDIVLPRLAQLDAPVASATPTCSSSSMLPEQRLSR